MISMNFAMALAVAFMWTTAFSMTNRFPVRGLRNLGILACYVIGISMFFVAGIKPAVSTWIMFGLIGGALYFIHDLIVRAKAKPEEEKPAISLGHFIFGQLAWPIMGPEAIEYALAELGVLKAPEPKETKGDSGNSQQPAK